MSDGPFVQFKRLAGLPRPIYRRYSGTGTPDDPFIVTDINEDGTPYEHDPNDDPGIAILDVTPDEADKLLNLTGEGLADEVTEYLGGGEEQP